MPPSTLAADSISLTAEAPYLAAGTNFLHGQEQFDYSVWWATLTSEDFTDAGDDRSVFEDLVRAHLTPLVDLSWSMSFKKNVDMCHILCSSHKFIYWRKPFDTGCSVLYQTRPTSPTHQFGRLGPCRAMLQNDSMLYPYCDIFVKFIYYAMLYKARNSTCPLARDKWIFRRTTKIANIVVRRTTWIAAGSVTRQRSSDFGVRF